MTKALKDGGAIVLRATSSVVSFGALALIAAIFVIDAVLRGRLLLALRIAVVAAFVLWVAWMFLVRMSVKAQVDAVLVRNLARWVRVPWAAVIAVERHAQLCLVLDDGSRIECWGSPFAPRRSRAGMTARERMRTDTMVGSPSRGSSLRSRRGVDTAWEALDAAWRSADSEPGPVSRGWDVPALVTGGILAVATGVALLV